MLLLKMFNISLLSIIKKMLNLQKLLPATLRQVQRYEDIIAVFQQYLYTDVKSQIDSFETRFNVATITDSDIQLSLYDFGYVLFQGQGWTGTSDYLRRQFNTIIQRIKLKGCNQSYEYLFYVYNLIGFVYPLIYQNDTSLLPFLLWMSIVGPPPHILLDSGRTLDEFIPWTLDAGDLVNSYTRHFLVRYAPKFIETTTEFMSLDTATSLYRDVLQNKRKVEIPHFEMTLQATAPPSQIMNPFVWHDFFNTITATQKSVVCGSGNLNNAFYVQFGNGAHATVDNTITGVQSLIQQLPLAGNFVIQLQDSTHLYFRHKLFTTTKFYDTSELAILDSGSNCLFYTTYPFIRYDINMLSSGFFSLSIQ